jgi:hypothetical protein
MAAVVAPRSDPKLLSSLGLLLLALVPGLMALLPGLMVPWWNFTDPEQKTYLTTGRRVYLGTVMVLACMPFAAMVVVPVACRALGATWAVGIRRAAVVVGILGVAAFVAVGMTTAGF